MVTEIAVYSEQTTLVSEGLKAVLQQLPDVTLPAVDFHDPQIHAEIRRIGLKIIFIIIKDLNNHHFDHVAELKQKSPSVSIIIVSMQVTREAVFKGIRCGAQGFISADTSPQEIQQAIFTVRNGHDYYSAAITNLLVSNYTNLIKNERSLEIKHVEKLSKRELEILALWGEGLQNNEIALKLFISIRTVETHKNNILQKLGIRTTVDLIKFAIRNNLISIE